MGRQQPYCTLDMEKINPPHLVAHLHFLQPHKSKQKNAKELPSKHTGDTANIDAWVLRTDRRAACNSGFAKKRVQWLIEHSTSHQILWYVDSLVLRNPLLRKAANRYRQA